MKPSDLVWLINRSRAYKDTFDTDPGRRVLRDLFVMCQMGKDGLAFDGAGRADPVATAAHTGRRLVFLHITSQIGLDETALMKLSEQGDEE